MYNEVRGCLDFIHHVYTVLGFPYSIKLSTRPESYIGELPLWDKYAPSFGFILLS